MHLVREPALRKRARRVQTAVPGYAVEIVAVQAGDAGCKAGDVAQGYELLLVELHVVVVVAHVVAAVAQEVEVVAELLGFQELDVALVDLERWVDALVFTVE